MSRNNTEDLNTLPSFAPIKRLRALFRYRFGWITAAALLISFVLMSMYQRIELDQWTQWTQWALGAVTFVLVAIGGLPEHLLDQKHAANPVHS